MKLTDRSAGHHQLVSAGGFSAKPQSTSPIVPTGSRT